MKVCQCSQCGMCSPGLVWGFGLLVRDGWGVAPATSPPGAAERAWLCSACASRAESVGRGLGRASTPKPKRAPRASLQPLKVLLVDDHVLMLRSLVRLLEGLQTVVASSARQALLLLHSGVKFDAIVSDVMMPIMSGPDLYARCYRESPELGRRFVFTSADPIAAGELIDRAAALVGAERAPVLLGKPTSRELLLAAIFSVATPHESGTYEIGLPDGIATFDADNTLGRGDSRPSKGSRGTR